MQIIAFCSLVEGRVCDDEDRVCCCVDCGEAADDGRTTERSIHDTIRYDTNERT